VCVRMCVRLYVCLAETVLALEYCHAQGIIHRDMKVRVCVRMCVCACVYVCLAETVLALEFCHTQGIIHRGMKVCVCVCVYARVCMYVWQRLYWLWSNATLKASFIGA